MVPFPFVFFKHMHLQELFFFLVFFYLFRAVPAAYGGSQARGQIGATTAGLRHGRVFDLYHMGSESGLQPMPQLMGTMDP